MRRTLIALIALAGAAAADNVRGAQLWTVTFGTDINGSSDYLVTNGEGSSYTLSNAWDVEGQTGENYVSTNGDNKRVHLQGDTGLSWADNFEFEIVFMLPENYAHNSQWPVIAELSGSNGSLRFGPYLDNDGNFHMDGTITKNDHTGDFISLTTGVQHTATVTLYEGTLTLKLDGNVAQTGTLNGGLAGTINNITLGGNSGSYYRLQENVYSISAYRVDTVPEPATATLSLLALTGLAARRRRK